MKNPLPDSTMCYPLTKKSPKSQKPHTLYMEMGFQSTMGNHKFTDLHDQTNFFEGLLSM
jgi:hypothetical protein